jgi:hypothetical protein
VEWKEDGRPRRWQSWRVGQCAGVCIGVDWDGNEGSRARGDVTPVSDYGKGMMGETRLRSLIESTERRNRRSFGFVWRWAHQTPLRMTD